MKLVPEIGVTTISQNLNDYFMTAPVLFHNKKSNNYPPWNEGI